MPLELTISNLEKIKVLATPMKIDGNPAIVDGMLNVSVQSGSSTYSQDGLAGNEVYLISDVHPGDTTYIIEIFTDIGSDYASIPVYVRDTVLLHVVDAYAANLNLTTNPAEFK